MATKFIPPTLDEWMFYADSIGWMPREDAEAAYDHYLACGWRIGSKPMCDWQAAARNCKRRSVARNAPMAGRPMGGNAQSGRSSLGALQMQLKAVEAQLEDIFYPGGCAFRVEPSEKNKQRAQALLAQRLSIKLQVESLCQ